MKTLILVEMLILWLGNINHYMKKLEKPLPEVVAEMGLRSSIPTAILAFWLFLVADLGAPKVAALFGGIIVFSYLMGALDTINNITDALMEEAVPEQADPAATDQKKSDSVLGDTSLPIG